MIGQSWRGEQLEKEQELSGGEAQTTNNRMELTAAIVAGEWVASTVGEQASGPGPHWAEQGLRVVEIRSDSQYLVKGVQEWLPRWQANGWRTSRGTAVENQDLWQRLLASWKGWPVRWYWVRGHDRDPLNERCDQLAVAASRQFRSGAQAQPGGVGGRGDGP